MRCVVNRIKFVLINPTSARWRVQAGERPRGPRVFRFSMLSSLYVAASMPPDVETKIIDEDVEALQATRLTPFPGTPLFAELDGQGRILDQDWAHYDFDHVVFEPLHMSGETLDRGVAWVSRQFYARRRVAWRVWKSLRYLDQVLVFGGLLPLNLGCRQRLIAEGNFQRGAAFVTEERRRLNCD